MGVLLVPSGFGEGYVNGEWGNGIEDLGFLDFHVSSREVITGG